MLRLTVASLLAHRLRLILTAVTIAIGAALVAGTFSLAARINAVRGAACAEGLVTASKVTLIGKNGRPITHRRAPSELLSYPNVPALAAPYTIQSGHPPRQPGQALLDAATARSLGY